MTADQVKIYVNNRKLMESEVLELGIAPEQLKLVFKVIDRKDKLNPQAWFTYSVEQGLSEDITHGLEKPFWVTKTYGRNLPIWYACLRSWNLIGLAEYVEYDPNIIRGLEYYTGTVFEARDKDGEFSAILGGGRYNNLVGDVGGQPVGGIGFAMGDVVISLVLQKFGCLPDFNLQPAQVMVTVFDEQTARCIDCIGE